MEILNPESGRGRGGRGVALVLVVLAVAAAIGIAAWLLLRRPASPKAPLPAPRARATAKPRPAPAPTAAPEARPRPTPEPRTAPVARALRVESDVPGANVFLDRKFLGTTPVETADFEPGPHRLNVSADGYEMYGETVELDEGRNEVVVRFKEVRLDERVDVVHKHGMGSCRGRLEATTAGLRYEADKAGDSFALPIGSLEPLQVDYLKKTLRVKQKGGKTWNFTGEADALLSFQKAVEGARKRMLEHE